MRRMIIAIAAVSSLHAQAYRFGRVWDGEKLLTNASAPLPGVGVAEEAAPPLPSGPSPSPGLPHEIVFIVAASAIAAGSSRIRLVNVLRLNSRLPQSIFANPPVVVCPARIL